MLFLSSCHEEPDWLVGVCSAYELVKPRLGVKGTPDRSVLQMESKLKRYLSTTGTAVASDDSKRVACFCNSCRGDRLVSKSTRSKHGTEFGVMYMHMGQSDLQLDDVELSGSAEGNIKWQKPMT